MDTLDFASTSDLVSCKDCHIKQTLLLSTAWLLLYEIPIRLSVALGDTLQFILLLAVLRIGSATGPVLGEKSTNMA